MHQWSSIMLKELVGLEGLHGQEGIEGIERLKDLKTSILKGLEKD